MSALDVALLRALRTAPAHLPASELAVQLATTPAVVRERIAELSGAGFQIEDRPGVGWRLLAAPDRLIADDLLARLDPSALVNKILVFKETSSTNDRVAQLGRDGAPGGVAIFAERQTAGRGRFGRRWESAPHLGLWFSLLLRPPLPMAEWTRLTTWAAVSVAAALDVTCAKRAQIKWPNDVQLAGKKVAGLLIETGVDGARAPFAVIGLGVNVNHQSGDFPPELSEKAGSLRQTTGLLMDRAEVAVAILRAFEANLGKLTGSFDGLVEEAARRSTLLGRWIELRSGDERIEGVAEGLAADGRLLLRDKGGSVRVLAAGEVTLSV